MHDQGRLPDLSALRELQRRGLCPRCAAELPTSDAECAVCAEVSSVGAARCATCGADMGQSELFCPECLAVPASRARGGSVVAASPVVATRAWSSTSSLSPAVLCPRCGAKSPESAERCSACWARLDATDEADANLAELHAAFDDAADATIATDIAEAPLDVADALMEIDDFSAPRAPALHQRPVAPRSLARPAASAETPAADPGPLAVSAGAGSAGAGGSALASEAASMIIEDEATRVSVDPPASQPAQDAAGGPTTSPASALASRPSRTVIPPQGAAAQPTRKAPSAEPSGAVVTANVVTPMPTPVPAPAPVPEKKPGGASVLQAKTANSKNSANSFDSRKETIAAAVAPAAPRPHSGAARGGAAGPEAARGASEAVRASTPEVRTETDRLRTCPLCGYENPSAAEFCGACWARVAPGGQDAATRMGVVPDPELAERWEVHGIQTGFVGRAHELSALCQIFDDVNNRGVQRLCTVLGDAGIGKSRLFGELCGWLREHAAGVRVYTVSCQEDEGQASMGPMVRILRERLGLRDNDGALESRDKLRRQAQKACAGPFAADVVATFEKFLGLAPIGGERDGAVSSDGEPGRGEGVRGGAPPSGPGVYRVWGALARFFEGDSREGPLVVCFDDAHHASPELLSALRHLAGSLQDARVLFVVLARSELLRRRPEWIEPTGAHVRLELGPLSLEESVPLVEGILGKAGFGSDFVHETCRRAGGSPLFLEELCRVALEQGPRNTTERALPGSVDDAVRRRVTFLSPEARGVLEKAAVVGRAFWLGSVVALTRLDASGFETDPADRARYWFGEDEARLVRRVLEELRGRDFISRNPQSTFPDEEEYVFKQATERELIYAGIPAEKAAPWHRFVSQWLLQRRGGSDDARFAQAARHRELAGDTAGAARLYLGAADRARHTTEAERCAELYERGLSLLPPHEVSTRLAVLHGLGDALARAGQFERAVQRFQEMLRCAWLLGQRAKGGAAYNRLGRIHRHLGRYAEAMAALSDGHTLFLEARDWRGVAASLDDIGQVHRLRGEFEQAMYHFQEALQLRRELGDARGIALSLYNLGELQRDGGRMGEAETNLEEGLRLIRQTDDRVGISALLSALGALLHEKGELRRAEALWKEAVELARDAGDRDAEGKILARMGELALSEGDTVRARALLAEATDLVRGLEDRAHLSPLLRSYAEAQLKHGDTERARDLAEEARALACELGSRHDEGAALRVLGEVHALTLFDDTAVGVALRSQAEEYFSEAVAIFEAHGNDLELGRTLTSYGNYLLERGQLERGRSELLRARELLGRRQAARSLARAELTIDKLP